MAVKIFCSPCGKEIHQPPAELLGPPDMSIRSRKHAICRTCFQRLMAYWPALREKAKADRGEAPAPATATPSGGTRPGRRGTPAP